jgi:hypothetical protein
MSVIVVALATPLGADLIMVALIEAFDTPSYS